MTEITSSISAMKLDSTRRDRAKVRSPNLQRKELSRDQNLVKVLIETENVNNAQQCLFLLRKIRDLFTSRLE